MRSSRSTSILCSPHLFRSAVPISFPSPSPSSVPSSSQLRCIPRPRYASLFDFVNYFNSGGCVIGILQPIQPFWTWTERWDLSLQARLALPIELIERRPGSYITSGPAPSGQAFTYTLHFTLNPRHHRRYLLLARKSLERTCLAFLPN